MSQHHLPSNFNPSFSFQTIPKISYRSRHHLGSNFNLSFSFHIVQKLVTAPDIIQLQISTYHSAFILSKNQLQAMSSFTSKIQTFIRLSYCPKIIHRLQNHLALIVAMQLDQTPYESWIYPGFLDHILRPLFKASHIFLLWHIYY